MYMYIAHICTHRCEVFLSIPHSRHTAHSTEGRKKRERERGWRRTVMVVGRVTGGGECKERGWDMGK